MQRALDAQLASVEILLPASAHDSVGQLPVTVAAVTLPLTVLQHCRNRQNDGCGGVHRCLQVTAVKCETALIKKDLLRQAAITFGQTDEVLSWIRAARGGKA
jgi:hypothetical protein